MYSQETTYLLHRQNLLLYGNIAPELFFCQKKNETEAANLDDFYQSLLIAWHNIMPCPISTMLSPKLMKKMPLYENMLIEQDKILIIPDWKVCGFKTLEKLLNEDGTWNTLHLQHLPLSNQRRLTYNYNQIKIYINKKISNQDPSENLNQIKFQFKLPHQEKFSIFPATKKKMYHTSLQAILPKPEVTGKSTITNKKINWVSLFSFPIDRRDSDISWRLLYNALPTPKKFTEWNIIRRKNCPWCLDKEGNIMHMMFYCKTTAPLWSFASRKICTINGNSPPLTLHQAMTGFPPTTQQARLANFILTLVKSTIYRTYINFIKEVSPPVPAYLLIFKKRLQYRFKLDEFYVNVTKSTPVFTQNFIQNVS